jgi:Mrp family chromosome partitioning ATPase
MHPVKTREGSSGLEMGRTYDLLTKARGTRRPYSTQGGGVDGPMPSILPLPSVEADEPARVELVPIAPDDLPSDNDTVPYIEVGGPKSKPAATVTVASPGVKLLEPKPQAKPVFGELSFHLLGNFEQLPQSGGTIPAGVVAYHQPEHPVARQYRLLVDGIAAQLPAGRSPVLMMTPTSTRTSASMTVLNLAAIRASDGSGRVLIVEAERAEESTSAKLGAPSAPGLRELLARSVPLTLALHRTGIDGVFLLPAGRADVGIDEYARLAGLLNQFRAKFDWVLIETPTWGMMPLNDFAKASDGVYLVMRPDEWDSPQADAAHQGIHHAGGRLRGCVTTSA